MEGTPAHKNRIHVVGDAILDRYIFGDVTRISLEAPVPVLLRERHEERAGGAANVAANIAALGCETLLSCIVGRDERCEALVKLLGRHGVECDLVVDDHYATTEKTRIISGSQQIVRIDREQEPSETATNSLLEAFIRGMQSSTVVYFSDYGKGSLRNLPEFIAVARNVGLRSIVDPKNPTPDRYRGSFLLKPNEAEFRRLFGEVSESDLPSTAIRALRDLDIQHMVITRGSRGMIHFSASGEKGEYRTDALSVFDVSGAGDTAGAALAVAISKGRSISDAVKFANKAAGIAVAHAGTYVVTRRDMEVLETPPARSGGEKIFSRRDLSSILEERRAEGQKIVFTNGCFDILHPGHIRMLSAAREEGDILVVALNSDASVHRLKGDGRPVNSLADRGEVLAALSAVDYVTSFDEDTPYEIINLLAPDVLVKGGDYTISDIVGADLVIERGGRVLALGFYSGYSSTKVIKKARG